METGMHGELVMEPQVHVAALADIVHDLVAGGLSHLQDGGWLRARATAAGLDRDEGAALEALRARLLDGGATFLAATGLVNW